MTISYLDLEKENLYGWEHRKSRGKVERYQRAVAENAPFPPVPVQIVEDGYELLMNVFLPGPGKCLDGGHTRAVAHYLARKPLKVEIVETSTRIPPHHRKNIRDIVLVDLDAKLWE